MKSTSEEVTQYRIRYDYPYLEARGESKWTGAYDSYEKAYDYMRGYYITAGYGRVLEVQTRTVCYGDWESREEKSA